MTEAELSKLVVIMLEHLELCGLLTFTIHRQHGRGKIPLPARQKGHTDFSVVRGGRIGYLELKNPDGKGRLKPEQEEFRDRVRLHGAEWACENSVVGVAKFLAERMGVRIPPSLTGDKRAE